MFCTKADTSWNTCSSFLLSCSGSDDHGVDHTLIKALQSSSLTFGFGNSKNATTCTFVRVSLVWPTLAIATMPFSWFLLCYVEHCQLTMYSVWHEGLPDHFRPCQNMWAPHYAAARDWLKSKGVSDLTDRSGVVYCAGCMCVRDKCFLSLLWYQCLSKLPAFLFVNVCKLFTINQDCK